METRTYLIQFCDSARYRFDYPGTKEELLKSSEIENFVGRLIDYVKKNFVGDYYKLYVTPGIIEVNGEESRFNDYAQFSTAVLDEVEQAVKVEIENMRSQKELDSNAPYSDIEN